MIKEEIKSTYLEYTVYVYYSHDGKISVTPWNHYAEIGKTYKEHNGYDIGDRLVNGFWEKGFCDDCCWCYCSKFKI